MVVEFGNQTPNLVPLEVILSVLFVVVLEFFVVLVRWWLVGVAAAAAAVGVKGWPAWSVWLWVLCSVWVWSVFCVDGVICGVLL